MEVSKDSGYPSRIPLGLASHSPFEAGCVSSAPATPAEPRASRKPICSFSRALRLSGSPELPARCHHGHHALSQRSVSSPSPWLQLSQHSRQEQKSLSLLLLLVPLLLPPPLLPCHRGPGAFLPLTIPESILCSPDCVTDVTMETFTSLPSWVCLLTAFSTFVSCILAGGRRKPLFLCNVYLKKKKIIPKPRRLLKPIY